MLAAAGEVGVDLPLSRQVRDRYYLLVHELGGADLDHCALYLELEARNRHPA
ncbi:hypothetical protein [Breoghania sp.]|uniref:hypothetical protein n=1 Tax=Breoghania sp. TaxID=2065378 RepID=UPI00262DA58A|nr:hypothetical protein [Breoghania sp.]MDJ0931994.1 hypothetical protein [Breoghania sp.]